MKHLKPSGNYMFHHQQLITFLFKTRGPHQTDSSPSLRGPDFDFLGVYDMSSLSNPINSMSKYSFIILASENIKQQTKLKCYMM